MNSKASIPFEFLRLFRISILQQSTGFQSPRKRATLVLLKIHRFGPTEFEGTNSKRTDPESQIPSTNFPLRPVNYSHIQIQSRDSK